MPLPSSPLDRTFDLLRGDASPEALALLLKALELEEADPEIRVRAASLLITRGGEAAFFGLHKAYGHLPEELRASLAASGAFQASVRVAAASADDFRRRSAVACLPVLGGEGYLLLARMLEDVSEGVRVTAARVLAGFLKPGKEPSREMGEAFLAALRTYRSHRETGILEAAMGMEALAHRVLLNVLADPGDPRRDDLKGLLSRSRSPGAASLLLAMVKDSRERVRDDAVAILTARRDEGAFQQAMATYLATTPLKHLQRLASTLKSIPWWPSDFPAAPEPLRIHLVSLLQEASQIAPTERLARLGNLLTAPEGAVRAGAAAQLAGLGHAAAHELLWRALQDPDEAVQAVALKALAESDHPEKRRILADRLNHPSPVLSGIAREVFAREGFRHYLASLPHMDEKSRVLAAQALAKLDPGLVQRIEGELEALEPERRLKALQLLAAAERSREAVEPLLALMRDPDRKVRAVVVRLLGLAGTREALVGLVRGLADPDPRVRANAVEGVGDLGDPRVGRLLLPFLHAPEPRVKANAVRALWKMGHKEAILHLEEMLRDPAEGVRLSAAWLLDAIDWPDARARLEHMAKADPSARIRERARRSLLKGGGA